MIILFPGLGFIYPYPSGLINCHRGNLRINQVPVKRPWCIWVKLVCTYMYQTKTKYIHVHYCLYELYSKPFICVECSVLLPSLYHSNKFHTYTNNIVSIDWFVQKLYVITPFHITSSIHAIIRISSTSSGQNGKRYFQTHFYGYKVLYFDSNYTENCS